MLRVIGSDGESRRHVTHKDVNNFMAMLYQGVDQRVAYRLLGGKSKCWASIREAVNRNLIRVHDRPDGPYEIEIIEPRGGKGA